MLPGNAALHSLHLMLHLDWMLLVLLDVGAVSYAVAIAEVTTAAEMQTAADEGASHIVVKDHLNLSNQHAWLSPSPSDYTSSAVTIAPSVIRIMV